MVCHIRTASKNVLKCIQKSVKRFLNRRLFNQPDIEDIQLVYQSVYKLNFLERFMVTNPSEGAVSILPKASGNPITLFVT